MLIIVGLGNPGKRYAMTRHNVGFMIVDCIACSFGFPDFSAKLGSLVSVGDVGSHRVMLVKPLSYMNNSGHALLRVISMYKITLSQMIVFHDDVALNQGVVKVKRGGSCGGHNGIDSLDVSIGKDYLRVRFGIGPSDTHNLSDFVLADFTNEKDLSASIASIANQLPMLLDGDIQGFVSRVSTQQKTQKLQINL